MRHILRFFSMLLLLTTALLTVGCAAEDDSVTQTGQGATLDTPDEVDVQGAASATCSRDPGRPVPTQKEEQFLQCVVTCQQAGNPHSGCYSACCQSITGCRYCYLQ